MVDKLKELECDTHKGKLNLTKEENVPDKELNFLWRTQIRLELCSRGIKAQNYFSGGETHVNQFSEISFRGDYNQLYSVHGKYERLIRRNFFLPRCCCFCGNFMSAFKMKFNAKN